MKSLGLGHGLSPRSRKKKFQLQVATRTGLPQSYSSQAGGASGNQVQQSMIIRIKRPTNNLVFRYCNYSIDGAPSKLLAGQAAYTVKAAIRFGGVTYPIQFPSGRVATIAVDEIVSSLPLNIPGGIAAGTEFELRDLKIFATAPTIWPTATRFNLSSGGVGGWNQFGTALADHVDTANTFYSRQVEMMVLPPFQILGDTPGHVAVAIMGDSIGSDGSSDGYMFTSGYSQRALEAANIPYVNNGASGNSFGYQIGSFSTAAEKARRRQSYLNRAVTHVFCALVTNDFANGRQPADILADMATLRAELNGLGIKLIAATGYPRTNAGNTGKGDYDAADMHARIATFRAALLNTPAAYADIVFDTYSVVCDGANPSLWNSAYLGDGVHPNAAGHTALAAYCQPLFAALT